MSNVVVVVFRAIATPEHLQEVLDAFESIALKTHAEEGCLGWAIHQGVENPNEIIEVSRWVSPEASVEHGATDHVQWILTVLNRPGVLQVPGELSTLRALGFGTAEKGWLSSGK
ncbi:MAG: antibiotic biosynthesis monooxygenase [Actinobacteria bacterium]|nr:antibiotic biosynthesis monooxygenase [Actinomycetota bacterium]